MNIAVEITEPRLIGINVNDNEIKAFLTDGRTISVPLAWSWRLSEATPKQRQNYEIIGDGQGVHWPDVDEDISVEGMLYGVPARRPGRLSGNSNFFQNQGLLKKLPQTYS